MEYRIDQIREIIESEGDVQNSNTLISHLLLDSRKLYHPDKSLFFALEGKRHNGHNYIKDLYERGVRYFVVSKAPVLTNEYAAASFLRVENTLNALQKLASYHRKQFNYPVIGISGSNGKTIVKEWLNQLLTPDYRIVRSPKSFNSQVGVPLSVWQMEAYHELGIFEAGISLPGEMSKLEEIIKPNIGILTNIGSAHSGGFESDKQKAREKLSLFEHCNTIIYSKDYQLIEEEIALKKTTEWKKKQLICWSMTDPNAYLFAKLAHSTSDNSDFNCTGKGKSFSLHFPFSDKASRENLLHCVCLMLYLDFELEEINKRIRTLHPVAMRLEMIKGFHNNYIVNDAYSSDLASLKIALDFMDQQKYPGSQTVILSDILESGLEERSLYEKIAQLFKGRKIHHFFGVGKAMERHKELFHNLDITHHSFYESTTSLLANLKPEEFSNQLILLKGSRRFRFEKISEKLQQQFHGSVMEINLDNLIHNLNCYRERLQTGVHIMAMVKAFSYGSGSSEIASILQFNHIDYLGVAFTDEAVSLRRAGISLPIMVMSPEHDSFDRIYQFHLEPEIYSIYILKELVYYIKHLPKGNRPIPIHIKLDTGMHRLGFGEEDIDTIIQTVRGEAGIRISSVFTHLAASEDPGEDDFSRDQLHHFLLLASKLQKAFPYPIWRHALNSAGIIRFPESQLEMVRLGLGLYGVDPSGELSANLKNVASLKSTIIQIKKVHSGDTIGYNRSGRVNKEGAIATINIGYADGLSRKLGNGRGFVVWKGQRVPFIGNICMDLSMLDISGLEGISEGDEVEIFGENISVPEFALWQDKIPYEALTAISQRVRRVYFQESY